MLHPTGSLLPGRVGRSSQPSSQNFQKSHRVKQPSQVVECPLHPDWVRRYDQAMVHVEKGGTVLHLPYPPVLPSRPPFHQRDPLPYHYVHHHIKNGWGRKCSIVTVLVANLPLHLSTGNYRGSAAVGMTSDTSEDLRLGGVSQYFLPPESMSCWVC